jgi:asparagine synthase (glutamine-hydrolysing)
MLVVFGPKGAGVEYIEKNIQPVLGEWGNKPPQIIRNQDQVIAFWPSRVFAEMIIKPYGWFLGNGYWEDLPPGYTESSKDLLEASLNIWRLEGVNFLKRLNGSFNLFIHDVNSGRSLVSTDRICTNPLWMAKLKDGGIAFSPCNEYLIPLVKQNIDMAALWSFLTRRRPISDRTLLESIKVVRQGTAICFDGLGNSKGVEWFSPRFEPEFNHSVSYWAAEFNKLVGKTVEKQLEHFKSPGLMLSGGIDSRLVASYCPPGTKCFTTADFYNREVKIAAKIAKICGLQHIPIIRDKDWYANTVEKSARHCVGLWRWYAPFIQLEHQEGAWQEIDCVLGGLWFDTFFKGHDVPEELWTSTQDVKDAGKAISLIMQLDEEEYKFMRQLKEVIRPGILGTSREAFEEVFRMEIERILSACTNIVEAFQLVQFGAIYCSYAYHMISYVRKFKAVINIVDNHLYDLFFRIPVSVKQSGAIVRVALWQKNKRLAFLSYSNSWLPAFLPNSFHKTALRARQKISHIRLKWYQLTKSQEYRSHGSWPQMNQLWAYNPKMREIMDRLVENPPVLVERFFDMDSVLKIWERHKKGLDDYTDIIGILVGLGFSGVGK